MKIYIKILKIYKIIVVVFSRWLQRIIEGNDIFVFLFVKLPKHKTTYTGSKTIC